MFGSLNPIFVSDTVSDSDTKGIILKVSLLSEETIHDGLKMLTIILPNILIFL